MKPITANELLIANQTALAALALVMCEITGIERDDMATRLAAYSSDSEAANTALEILRAIISDRSAPTH